MNPMQSIRLEKVTLNIGAGKDQAKLEKGIKLIKSITGSDPVKTMTNKRIPAWGLRPGLPIGCKLTIRKKPAAELLLRLLEAKNLVLSPSQFDDKGNIAFGIQEYIDIPRVAYQPEIGVLGLQVCVTLERPGFRVKRRRLRQKQIPLRHQITKKDAQSFMQQNFKVKVEDQQ